jgi:hypothetical protein
MLRGTLAQPLAQSRVVPPTRPIADGAAVKAQPATGTTLADGGAGDVDNDGPPLLHR